MTTLVGIMYKDGENKKVIIGADSRVTLGQVKTTIKDSKIFILKGSDKQRYLMAICGLEKILNLTKYSFKVPNRDPKRKDDYDFLINQFMPSLEHFFKEKDLVTRKNHRVEIEANMLLGFNGQLYTIGNDLGLSSGSEMALGSGRFFALGSLFSTRNIKDSRKRAKIALQAAAHYSSTVGPPFPIRSL